MRYDADTCAVLLSVRELCAMAHKSGHLDARSPRRPYAAMQAGSEAHRRIQAGEERAEVEVQLRNTTTYHGITYTVEGRADSVIEEENGLLVEEIKTSRSQAGARQDAFSQLRCYAYFLCEARGLPRIRMRMRVCNPDSGEVRDSYSEA